MAIDENRAHKRRENGPFARGIQCALATAQTRFDAMAIESLRELDPTGALARLRCAAHRAVVPMR
ncbi:hypothetical protein [Lysobacter sp. CA199]|uniref:hypothetical protein n=1 Tax=Lysobacter sp. CA199 TaxID=3455608 RepID=UPI003F8D7131